MKSQMSSSVAANRSGSRSNGSSRSSKLDPTGMYKKPKQQQVKCHYLDPTGLYWEVRKKRSCRCVTPSRVAHPTNVNCDSVLGALHGFGQGSADSGDEQRYECTTHERWLSCGSFGWGSVAARKRPAVGAGERSWIGTFRRTFPYASPTGMPENII